MHVATTGLARCWNRDLLSTLLLWAAAYGTVEDPATCLDASVRALALSQPALPPSVRQAGRQAICRRDLSEAAEPS